MSVDVDQNVDPALWPLVEAFPPIDLTAETLDAFRAAMVRMSPMPDPSTHPDVHAEEITIPTQSASARSLRSLIFRPKQRSSRGALLHVHGGGFVMGLPEMDAPRNIELVRATGCTILSVDYRLAPEHPHPAGLEDCHAALVWLAAQAGSFGIPAGRIGVIGESAGGGLAAALASVARDRQSVRLACQALIYPMLVPPAHSSEATSDARTGRFIWTRTSNEYAWSAYLGGKPIDSSGSAGTIAGLAQDLAGLPPAFLAVGELDLFVHDILTYASRLLAAGCSVDAHVYPGAVHAFDRRVEAPVSVRFTRDLVGFIQRHLG